MTRARNTTNLTELLVASVLTVACSNSDQPTDGAASDVHEGYSENADQYEVSGRVISNVDVNAPLWNPRGKSPEQQAERAQFLTDSYDLKRTETQQARAEKARESFADAVVVNSVMPSAVGVVQVTETEFRKGLQRNRDAGVTLVSCTVFAFPGDGDMDLMERFEKSRAIIDDAGMVLVDTVEDIRQAKRDGRTAVIFNTQGSDYAIRDMTMMATVHGEGVRVANFTYNNNNALAGGGTKQDMGVSALGEEFVRACNSEGIVVDVAHSSNETAIDAARLSTKPVIASHANASALCRLNRNMSDDAIKAVGATGGVIATTGVGLFLNAEGLASPEEFAKHVVYTAKLIGKDKTGFSTDYMHNAAVMFANNVANVDVYPPEQGFGFPATNMAAEHVWDVVAILEDEYDWSDEEIRGFLGENLLRVYAANWE